MAYKSFEMDGFAELDAQLAAIGTAMATELAEEATRAPMEALAAEWRAKAPYRPGTHFKVYTAKSGKVRRTDYGHLRDNIRVTPVKNRSTSYVAYQVGIGDAFWGFFLEYGTRRMPARPWARPIADGFAARGLSMMVTILREGIAEAAAYGRAFGDDGIGGRKFGPMLPNGRNA